MVSFFMIVSFLTLNLIYAFFIFPPPRFSFASPSRVGDPARPDPTGPFEFCPYFRRDVRRSRFGTMETSSVLSAFSLFPLPNLLRLPPPLKLFFRAPYLVHCLSPPPDPSTFLSRGKDLSHPPKPVSFRVFPLDLVSDGRPG